MTKFFSLFFKNLTAFTLWEWALNELSFLVCSFLLFFEFLMFSFSDASFSAVFSCSSRDQIWTVPSKVAESSKLSEMSMSETQSSWL